MKNLYISIALILGVIIMQFLLSTLFYKIIPYDDVEKLVLIAIDLSYIFAFITLYYITKNCNSLYYEKSIPKTILYIIVFIIFSFLSTGLRFSNFLNFSFESGNSFYNEWDNYKLFRSIIIIPFLEEFIFRKFLFNFLSKSKLNILFSIIVTNIFFSIAHLNLDDFLIFFFAGFFLSQIYLRSQNIVVPIVCHSFVNCLIIFLW